MNIEQVIALLIFGQVALLIIWGAIIKPMIEDKRNAKARNDLLGHALDPDILDPATNMPLLPEGFAWKVRFRKGVYERWDDCILEIKRGKAQAYYKEWHVKRPNKEDGGEKYVAVKPEDMPEYVQLAGISTLENLLEDNELEIKRLKLVNAMEALEGDYPPKRLSITE